MQQLRCGGSQDSKRLLQDPRELETNRDLEATFESSRKNICSNQPCFQIAYQSEKTNVPNQAHHPQSHGTSQCLNLR